MTIAGYREAAHHFLQQANAEWRLGDLGEASEKAWGAAAQIAKAHAESLAPSTCHHSRGDQKWIARGLARITGNQDFLVFINAVALCGTQHPVTP